MANIAHRWKKVLAVSCSHAKYCDKEALDAVLRFKNDFKPHTTIHLGDFVDLTALMSGAKGASEAEPLILSCQMTQAERRLWHYLYQALHMFSYRPAV